MKREEETVLRLPQRAPEDVERALRLSVGDIEQQVTAMMGALASKVALSQVVLDCLGLGVVLLDPEGRVLQANGTAERMLAEADGLMLADGRLLLPQGDNARLQCFLRKGEGTRALRAARRGGRPDYLVTLAWLRCDDAPAIGRVAMALVDDLGSDPSTELHLLEDLYDLTPAQSRLAWHLASGHTAAECAETLGVSQATVKAHLRELFAKTDTHRQSDLIRLILRALRLGGTGR
ncbi:helix-turn-helix transcriptional regulator [Chitinimonas koreensis]|uniref:helix-turn-helix transcriptional regulator n=1 Tax=Chitinimonas koreensis TaxID=356302 RepID=UPI0004294F8D|nr:LuxR C-terminal-related transcriptional regulator [Chitinimonas koreensis]